MRARAWLSALLAAAASFVLHRGDAFWCGARGIPLGTFWRTPGFSIEQMPLLAGKVVLVTGANTGLGLEVARELLLANATVIVACRNASKCAAATAELRAGAAHGGWRGREERRRRAVASVRALRLDLNDLRQVAAAAVALNELDALHAVVANAGVATHFPLTLSVDSVETTFQANYLGHFALTRALLPLLERTAQRSGAPARLVHLTSGAHRGAPAVGVPLSLEGVNEPSLGPYARYGMAKLANLAFSCELARRYPATLRSNAVHPGVVASSMLRRANFAAMLGPRLGGAAWRLAQLRNVLFAYAPRAAALTPLHGLATARSGALFVPVATEWAPRHPRAAEPAFGAALWAWSEQVVAAATAGEDARATPGPGPWLGPWEKLL